MNTAETLPLVEKWSEEYSTTVRQDGPAWLQELRENAASQFGSAGLPTRKDEAWKYTPVRLLEGLRPTTVRGDGNSVADTCFPEPVVGADAGVVSIGNGVLSLQLPEMMAGVTLLPMREAFKKYADRLQPLLAAVELEGAGRMFSALNTAFLDQGLVVHVDENTQAGKLLVRWAFSGEDSIRLGNFRLVLLLEQGAKLDLIEQYESVGAASGALNVLTQIDLSNDAELSHVRIQDEGDGCVLLTSTSIQQAAASVYQYSGFDLGGGLVRHELHSELAGAGAFAGFDGAFVLDQKRHVDNHISVDHAAPGCSSKQFFRGVLGGSSRGVFNGRALIRPGADESVVHQSNANLLLSRLAEIDTKPELEIYADEVVASHGATVGQLDESAIFYMRTRGLSDSEARRMLTAAFCHAVSDRLGDAGLSEVISSRLDAAMPNDQPIAAETSDA
jgi:Fe-S cluster assembly protein SufD